MRSKERICAAMRCQDVDDWPCSIYSESNLRVGEYDCSHLRDRVALSIDLGVDPFVPVGMGAWMHPEVQVSNWVEETPGESYPILWQAWDAPGGRLTKAARKGLACENWTTTHWRDQSASSLYKPLIEAHAEIELFRYLAQPTREEDHTSWASRQ